MQVALVWGWGSFWDARVKEMEEGESCADQGCTTPTFQTSSQSPPVPTPPRSPLNHAAVESPPLLLASLPPPPPPPPPTSIKFRSVNRTASVNQHTPFVLQIQSNNHVCSLGAPAFPCTHRGPLLLGRPTHASRDSRKHGGALSRLPLARRIARPRQDRNRR